MATHTAKPAMGRPRLDQAVRLRVEEEAAQVALLRRRLQDHTMTRWKWMTAAMTQHTSGVALGMSWTTFDGSARLSPT